MQQLKFVIVGHVDHGKSTLIGRLFYDTDSLPPDKMAEIERSSKELGREIEFAFLMDHLKEEREQGITIDTAQAFFKTKKREYVIIDAPGHVEFVKNMITGASQAEAGIVILDAVEGVREQTKRHSYILSMLGLEQVIVLINKMDLVDYKKESFNKQKEEMSNFLNSINIKPQYYIPTSAMNGDNVAKKSKNMNWYQGPACLDALDSFKNKMPSEKKSFIFPVQDIYKIDDKRIIVGRVESGIINTGDEVIVLPSKEKTKIKSIEKFLEKDIKKAFPEESIGVTTSSPLFIDRGYILCQEDDKPALTDTFKANVFWLSKKEFDINKKIIIRCVTQEMNGKVEKIEKRINSSSLELIDEDA